MNRLKSARALLGIAIAAGLFLSLGATAAEARTHHKSQRTTKRHAVERGNRVHSRSRPSSPPRGAQANAASKKSSNHSTGARAGRTNSK
jgi:hypothetical protein